MTNRYDLLIQSIQDTNQFILYMFLYALCAIVGYYALEWSPVFVRRPLQYIYLASLLIASILLTVFN